MTASKAITPLPNAYSEEKTFGNPVDHSFSWEMYFPTMVFNIMCTGHEALNRYLLELIYAEREWDLEGIERSNFRGLGGWHIHTALHKEPGYKPLTDRIDQAGRRISRVLGYHSERRLNIGTMWSIINPPSSSNETHIHPGCLWSGVYYVHMPDAAGDIEFIDPRTPHVMNQPSFQPGKKRSRENWTKVRYSPDPGKMLLFPSWLYHGVEPNLFGKSGKEGDRVVISFNLSQTKG